MLQRAAFVLLCQAAALSLFMAAYGTSSGVTNSCPPSYHCGDQVEIHYPFWLKSENDTSNQYCGYPDLDLQCSFDGKPVLSLPNSDSYYVKDINYENFTITLVDIDVVGKTCPRALHNVTLSNLPLKLSGIDLTLNFYFNCSSTPASIDNIPCLRYESSYDGVKRYSYVFEAGKEPVGFDWSGKCLEKVVVTVMKDEIGNGDLISGFGAAMNKGFVLEWNAAMDCIQCEASSGYCGFDDSTKQFLCFCNDGSISRSNHCKGN